MICLQWILATLIFLCLGSFLNVVIYRYPKMLFKQWHLEATDYLDHDTDTNGSNNEIFNIAWPHSHCPKCQHPIQWWHNLPLISFLLLRGKCHYCQSKISWRYPLVELLTLCLSIILLYIYGFSAIVIIPLISTYLLIALTFIDFEHQLIPDLFSLSFLWLGLLQNTMFHIIPLNWAIYGSIIGYVLLWSIGWLYKLVRKQDGMGYGDYKLLAAIGAWVGPYLLIFALLGASILSLIISVILLATAKINKSKPLAFGPYLAFMAYILLCIKPTLLLSWVYGI